MGSFLRLGFNKLSGFNFDNLSRIPPKIPFSFFIPKYFSANFFFLLSSLASILFLASYVSLESKPVNVLPLSGDLDLDNSLVVTKLFGMLLPSSPPLGRRIELLSAIFLFSYSFLILLSASSFFACYFSSICLGEENIFLPALFPSNPSPIPELIEVAAARPA